jgi:hypothetical protein
MLGVPTCRRHKQSNKLKTPTFFATLDYIMYVPSLGFIHLVHVVQYVCTYVCRMSCICTYMYHVHVAVHDMYNYASSCVPHVQQY